MEVCRVSSHFQLVQRRASSRRGQEAGTAGSPWPPPSNAVGPQMLDVSSNPVQARGWAVIWDACSDLTDVAQTQVTKQRQEGVQAEFVGPRRIGAWVGSDTLGPCPRQDAVSGTPLLQQEEEEAPHDEGLGTAGLHQATQAPEGKSRGVECGPREVSVGHLGAGPPGPLWASPRVPCGRAPEPCLCGTE